MDAALGKIRWLPEDRARPGMDMKALSWDGRIGRTGGGLVDLLRRDGLRASLSASCAPGLSSNASRIRPAVLIEELRVGGVGSDGSGNVLERLRPRGLVGGLLVIGNALGGEVGLRIACLGRVGDGEIGAVRFGVSNVGDAAPLASTVRLVSNVGEVAPLIAIDGLLSLEPERLGPSKVGAAVSLGIRGKGASSLVFEVVRVCKLGRDGTEEDWTTVGLARALLAAVGSVSRELLANGIVGLLLKDDTGGTGGGAFEATNGVFALLEGALFVEGPKFNGGRGGKG